MRANSSLKNGLLNLVASLIALAVAIIANPLLVKLLGFDQYGLWSLANAVLGVVALAEAGLSLSAMVFFSKDIENGDSQEMSRTLISAVICMLVLASAAGLLLWNGAFPLVSLFSGLNTAQKLTVSEALQLGSLIVWCRLMQQVGLGILQAQNRYLITSILISTQNILLNLVLLFVAWRAGNIVSMIESNIAVAALYLVITLTLTLYTLLPYKLGFAFSLSKLLRIARHSASVWGVSIGSVMFTQMDRIIVGTLLGASDLGVYALITSVATKINSVSAALVQPLVPSLSRHLVRSGDASSELVVDVRRMFTLSTVVAFSLGLGMFAASPILVSLISPDKSSPAFVIALQTAVVIYALYSANAVGYYILLTTSPSVCFQVQLASVIFSLLLIAIGSYVYGLQGAVIGNAGALSISLLTVIGMARVRIPSKLWLRWIFIPLAWFILAGVMVACVSSWWLLSLGLALASITGIFVWWAISEVHLNQHTLLLAIRSIGKRFRVPA